MTTLIVIASIAVYVVGWYRTSLMVARRMNESEQRGRTYRVLDDGDRRFNLGAAMAAACIWPVILPLLFIHSQMLNQVGPTPKDLAQENERLSREIDRLEREAGIR